MLNKKAIELAKADVVFARILTAPEPQRAMLTLQKYMWLKLTDKLATTAWVIPAIDAKEGIFKDAALYAVDPVEIEEIEKVQKHFRRFNLYADTLVIATKKPLSDYLNGITIEDFRDLLKDKRGMDAAREIQYLYEQEILDSDIGGSQLHGFLEDMGLPYIPTVNHLNAARRGEIPKGRYNMSKSRLKDESYLK